MSQWPKVVFESHDWERDPSVQISRSQARKIRSTYEAAVVPDIAEVASLPLDLETLAELDDASRALAKFDVTHGGNLSNFSALLLRTESVASSQIENLTASAKAIITEEVARTGKQNPALIVANTQAMTAAIKLADRLDPEAIIQMQEALFSAQGPHLVGTFRHEQVWIGGSNFGPFEAVFVPPHHQRVPGNINDLCRFMERDDLPALAQATIAHAQFEAIHPFPDGNGRTGRALVQGLLRGKGVTRHVTVPISAGLLSDTGRYFGALTAYQRGDPQPIAKCFAEASFLAVNNGTKLSDDIDAISSGWAETVRARRGSAARDLLEALPGQPVIDMHVVTNRFGLSSSAGARAVDALVDVGVLKQVGGGARNRKWAATQILEALDEFAARSIRPRP